MNDASLSMMQQVLEALDEGVLLFDEADVCTYASRRVTEMFGEPHEGLVGAARDEVIGRLSQRTRAPDLLRISLTQPDRDATVIDPVEIVGPRPCIVAWTASGAKRALRFDVIREVTRERRAAAAVRDLTERLERESVRDALTGLSNRRHFLAECEREHRRAQRAWDSYAILRLDVDGMAELNRAAGRKVGDEALACLGQMISTARREYDLVARLGDDEFGVLLPGADPVATGAVLRRILAGVAAAPLAIEGEPDVTISGGAAVWSPPSGESARDTFERAGEALVLSRARGEGRFELDLGSGFRFSTNAELD